MQDEILSYREMCDREGIQTLQRGMNFRLNQSHSVVLMSQRSNAPYTDRVLEDGETIEYEGHDAIRRGPTNDPKKLDEPRTLPSGKLTQNGLFAEAIDEYLAKKKGAELVRVYEKLFPGVWSDKGLFELTKYQFISDGQRRVFRFYLSATGSDAKPRDAFPELGHLRLIPSEVKKEVWKRDKGRCVMCDGKDNLHFDHDIPWSKGGSSLKTENVRILCARHNLEKSDKIE